MPPNASQQAKRDRSKEPNLKEASTSVTAVTLVERTIPSQDASQDLESKGQHRKLEKICHHVIKEGKVWYEVQWEGVEDHSLEPASAIEENYSEICTAYRNQQRDRGYKKRKRYHELDALLSPEGNVSVIDKKYRDRMNTLGITWNVIVKDGFDLAYASHWPNVSTDWRKGIRCINDILPIQTSKQLQLLAYVEWNSGEKTVHLVEELHERCPHKLIGYYEERLDFG